MRRIWLLVVLLIAVIALILFLPRAHARDDGRWANADPAVRAWYEQATLTPAARKRFGFDSCCAHSDVVRTQFRVSRQDGTDQWWWLHNGAWKQVPADIIHWGEAAPDGRPTLFAIGSGEPSCFYPGDSGQ